MTIQQNAIAAAHKTDGNAEFSFAQSDAVATFMKNKTRAYSLFLVMRDVHGKDMDTLPVPGSEAPASNNPDKFKVTVEGREVDASFWNTYADNTEFATKLDKKQPNAGFMTVLNMISKEQAPYSDWNPTQIDEAKKMATQRRDANRKAVNTAAKIYFQKIKVEDFGAGEVTVEFKSIKDKDGTIIYDENTTVPIIVAAAGEGASRDEYKQFSVGEFLAFDMAKAKALFEAGNVSRFLAVKKSGGKGKKGGKKTPDATKLGEARIKTVGQMELAMLAVANYLGGDGMAEDNVEGYTKLMSHLASLTGDNRKAFVVTIGTVCNAFDAVYTEIGDEYRAAIQEKVRAKSGPRKVATAAAPTA